MQKLFLTAAILVAPLLVGWKMVSAFSRRRRISGKYAKADVAWKILNKQLWVGQTAEQVIDALGRPSDIDQKLSKTKAKQTWRYDRQGKNRFGLKVVLEDGLVVGWDGKSQPKP
jgi:outer membrane protein assembly factor BamE (lipoprotein component of BamABCDE complex)